LEGLSACAQAVFFEPGNIEGQTEPGFQYLHREPKNGELYSYCKDFASSEAMVCEDGPEIFLCCGSNEGGEHLFLKEDGSRVCTGCASTVCRFCFMESTTDDKSPICIPCYTKELGTRGVVLTNLPSETLMKEKLIQANVQEVEKASSFELFDMYEAIVMNDSIGRTHSAKAVLVKYPLVPSSCVHNLKVLSKFDFIEGGRLIRDENLSDENRISIIHLMAKLVEYGGRSRSEMQGFCKRESILCLANNSHRMDGAK
jgi:hypothetical protein